MSPADDRTTRSLADQSGIYRIRCLDDGKVYIGSAVCFRVRWTGHRKALKKGTHHSHHLQRAWNKRGAGRFVFEVIEVVADPEQLVPREQEWLDRTRAANKRHGYNSSPTAGSTLGYRHRPESIEKCRIASTGRQFSEEARALKSAAAKRQMANPAARQRISECRRSHKASPETLRKMSEVRKGTKHSDATRAKMSAAQKGRTATEQTRRKMSLAMKGRKGRKLTPEEAEKLHDSWRGSKHSEESRALMSKALKGRVIDDAWRKKLSEAAKRRHARPEEKARDRDILAKARAARYGKPKDSPGQATFNFPD